MAEEPLLLDLFAPWPISVLTSSCWEKSTTHKGSRDISKFYSTIHLLCKSDPESMDDNHCYSMTFLGKPVPDRCSETFMETKDFNLPVPLKGTGNIY